MVRPVLPQAGKGPLSQATVFRAQHVETFERTGNAAPAELDRWRSYHRACADHPIVFIRRCCAGECQGEDRKLRTKVERADGVGEEQRPAGVNWTDFPAVF